MEKVYVCVRVFGDDEEELLGRKFTLHGWKIWLLRKHLEYYGEIFDAFEDDFIKEYSEKVNFDKEKVISYIETYFDVKLVPLEDDKLKFLIVDTGELITENQLRQMVLTEETNDILNNCAEYVNGELNIIYQCGCLQKAINSDIYEILEMANSSWNIPVMKIW